MTKKIYPVPIRGQRLQERRNTSCMVDEIKSQMEFRFRGIVQVQKVAQFMDLFFALDIAAYVRVVTYMSKRTNIFHVDLYCTSEHAEALSAQFMEGEKLYAHGWQKYFHGIDHVVRTFAHIFRDALYKELNEKSCDMVRALRQKNGFGVPLTTEDLSVVHKDLGQYIRFMIMRGVPVNIPCEEGFADIMKILERVGLTLHDVVHDNELLSVLHAQYTQG